MLPKRGWRSFGFIKSHFSRSRFREPTCVWTKARAVAQAIPRIDRETPSRFVFARI
jgi:hypothetical protein